jgi:hypothetical protein
MSIPRILSGAALVAALSIPLVAQQQNTTDYYEVACVKVNQNQNAAARDWVAGTDHKLSQALVDSGQIRSVLVLRTVMPQGTEANCDYVFVTFFNGSPLAPMSTEDVSKALHDAGIQMTPEQFFTQRGELGTLVNLNVTQNQAMVGEAKKGDYLVLNQMNAPDSDACIAYEKKVWQPLAEEMMRAGDSDGWVIQMQVFPGGAKDQGGVSSVDIYPSWDAVFKQRDSIQNGWKKVHPDMDVNNTFQQFGKLCPIEHTVLYKVEDMVGPKQ